MNNAAVIKCSGSELLTYVTLSPDFISHISTHAFDVINAHRASVSYFAFSLDDVVEMKITCVRTL